MAFVATWMDLRISILSEVRWRKISYVITYMWNTKKNDTDGLMYETETHSLQKTNLCLPKGQGGREG